VGENHVDGSHGTTDVHSSGNLSSRNGCQKVSQLVDKPVDEVPADVQYRIGGNSQQINEALQGTRSIQSELPVLTKYVYPSSRTDVARRRSNQRTSSLAP